MSHPRWARMAVVLLALGMLVLASCGDDDEAGNVFALGRYCELAMQLDDNAVGTGAASAPGTFDGDPEAIGRLFAQVGPILDQLVESAPEEIHDDVEMTVEALRKARAGDVAQLRSPEVRQAARSTTRFRERSCARGGTTGEA